MPPSKPSKHLRAQVPDVSKLKFQVENLLITARRFQLPRLNVMREIHGEMEDLTRATRAASPDCEEAAAKLRRYGPIGLKAQQIKQMDELRRAVGLAERMPHVGDLGQELEASVVAGWGRMELGRETFRPLLCGFSRVETWGSFRRRRRPGVR